MMTAGHCPAPNAMPYVVPVARASDAVGESLRRAYDRAPGLTDDLAALLAAIDRPGRA